MSLTMVSIGEEKIIKEIRAKESVKRHLQNLGFITGEKIEVVSENSSGLILMIKGSKIALNKVVLPAPFFPIIPVIVPGFISNEQFK